MAGLVAARALITAGQPGRAARIAARYGPPGRVDRLDTRLLWRLARAELAAAGGRRAEASRQLLAGMAALHRHRTQFGCLDLQTGAAVHGQDLARAGLAAALASGSPAAVYRWSERARAQALLLPAVGRRTTRPPRRRWRSCGRPGTRCARGSWPDGRPAACAPGSRPLQRRVREQSWTTPGRRDVRAPAPAPFSAVRDDLAGAVLVIYLRDGPGLRALVVVGDSAWLRPLGDYAAAAEAVLRLRADLDVQAGRALPGQLAAAVAAATRRDAAALADAVLTPLLAGGRPRPGRGADRHPDHRAVGGAARLRGTAGDGGAVGHRLARRQAPAADRQPARPGPAAAGRPAGRRAGQRPRRRGGAAIAALRPGASVLTGAAATPAATLAGLAVAAVAHLAAHGQHQAENALFSTLELAGGPLLGYDLQRVARVPSMVVLSSCDLGLTDVRPGDETFGMVTALLNAGAGTVVASVARVADDTAMAAMVGYHHAITAGTPPAAALAAALQRETTAGFVCFGAG